MNSATVRRAGVVACICGLAHFSVAAIPRADAGTLTVLTYNSAGLPPLVQTNKRDPRLDPLVHIPLIAERLTAARYDLIALQEAFVQDPRFDSGAPYDESALSVGPLFYDQLTANVGDPAYAQIAPRDSVRLIGNLPRVASGLARLSNSSFSEYRRDRWDRLAGADGLSDKGYSFARHRLAEGVFVDIYNWHGNAGSDVSEGGPAARADNVEELIRAINANSSGRAVIVLGDTNALYPRSFDTIRRLLGLQEGPAGSEDLDRPLKDVWIERTRSGAVPEQNDVRLNACDGPDGQAGSHCEHRDKVLFRSGRDIELRALDYFVEEDFAVPGTSIQLSDHFPVGAKFGFTLRYNRRIPNLAGQIRADLTLRRGNAYLIDSKANGGAPERTLLFGLADDDILLGLMDRDRRDEIVVRRGRNYFIDRRNDGGLAEKSFGYGKPGDTVFVGDHDGDGRESLTIRRGNRYRIDSANNGGGPEAVIRYGTATDIVFLADLDGNGTQDLVARRGNIYHVDTGNDGGFAETILQFGREPDIVFVADIDGSGSDDLVIRRGRRYLADTGNDGGAAERTLIFQRRRDPVYVGDMDGNGTDDLIVRRGNEFRIDTGNDGDPPELIFTYGDNDDVLVLK